MEEENPYRAFDEGKGEAGAVETGLPIARCPVCSEAVSRMGIFSDRVSCRGCKRALRQVPAWRLGGNIVWALLFFPILGCAFFLVGPEPVPVFVMSAACWFFLGWSTFPYTTRFELQHPKEDRD